jgi:hypothetical protein
MSILGKIFSAGAGDLVKNVGGVLDSLTTTKEEKLAAEAKIKDLIMGYEAEMQKQVTERWKLDMNSDVKDSYVDLLQLVLITVIGAYFGGRSLEKVKK